MRANFLFAHTCKGLNGRKFLLIQDAYSSVGSTGARRLTPTFYLRGGRNFVRCPLKTDIVILCKVFSNFFHHTYLHFKIKYLYI